MKKLNTRGRKREARRWIQEADRRARVRCYGEGPPRAGIHAQGRTFGERADAAALAWVHESDELNAREPVLYAAVMEVMWADILRSNKLTPEQHYARFKRRMANRWREKLRAERNIRSQL